MLSTVDVPPPDNESNTALSAMLIPAPPAPLDDKAHLAAVLQLPVPPTQYLLTPNIHPVLPPPLVELTAYHEAPPPAIELVMERYCDKTVPLALESVWVAAVALLMVTRLPEMPLTFQLVTVVVVPAVKLNVVG